MGKIKVEDPFFNSFAPSEPLLTGPNMKSPGLDSPGDFARTSLELSPPKGLHNFKASASYVAERHRYRDAKPGELWLSAKKNEKPWPVVICDEEMLQILLKGRDRPVNARQGDGTWRNQYGPGGHLAEQRCFPTMRLGSTVLCWTPWKRLKSLDICLVQSINQSTDNPGLANAYAEVIEQYGTNDLTYWKDKLFARQLSRADTPQLTKFKKERDLNPMKRKMDQHGFRYPPTEIAGYRIWGDKNLSSSDDEAPAKKIKLESHSASGLFQSSIWRQGSLSRTPIVEVGSKESLTPLDLPSQSETAHTVTSQGPNVKSFDIYSTATNSTNITLYVGSPHTLFSVKPSALQLSPHLRAKLSHDPILGQYVMSPLLATVNPPDFTELASYLNGNDVLQSINTKDDSIVWAEEQFHHIAKIYHIAEGLGLNELIRTAVNRLKRADVQLTAKFQDVVKQLLKKKELVGAGTTLRKLSVRYLAEWFWEFARLDDGKLSEVLEVDSEFTREVLEMMASILEKKHTDATAET